MKRPKEAGSRQQQKSAETLQNHTPELLTEMRESRASGDSDGDDGSSRMDGTAMECGNWSNGIADKCEHDNGIV